MTDELLIRYIACGIDIAQKNIGYGEDTENNHGRFLDAIGGRPGEEWCALFASWPYRRAAQLMNLPPPTWCYRRPGFIEVGAGALVKAMAKEGRFFRDPGQAQAGDLMLFRRPGFSWSRHVEFVEGTEDGGIVHTIAGNVGRFPAKVRRLTHDGIRDDRVEGFASLRRG